jgi:hypothetical protein
MARKSLWILIGALALVPACASRPKVMDSPVSATLAESFSSCNQVEGVSNVRLHRGSAFLGSADLEWVSDVNAWKLELLTPIASTLASLAYDGTKGPMQTSGSLSDQLPEFEADQHGRLMVDGSFTGVMAAELPCLLNFSLPHTWQGKLMAVQGAEANRRYFGEDKWRQLNVVFKGRDASAARAFCATIRWQSWLWFIWHSVDYCVEASNGPKSASITGLGDYQVYWVNLND